MKKLFHSLFLLVFIVSLVPLFITIGYWVKIDYIMITLGSILIIVITIMSILTNIERIRVRSFKV